MLRARIFTAVIVLCLFLAALLYLPAIFWMILLLALTVTGSWEWSRLAKFSVTHSIVYLLLTTMLAGELLFVLSQAVVADPYTTSFLSFYVASLIFWTLIVPYLAEVAVSYQESTPARVGRLAGAAANQLCLIPVTSHRSAAPAGIHGCDLDIRYSGIFCRTRIREAQACTQHQPGQDLGRCCRSAGCCFHLCADMEPMSPEKRHISNS